LKAFSQLPIQPLLFLELLTPLALQPALCGIVRDFLSVFLKFFKEICNAADATLLDIFRCAINGRNIT
jgi:hypothetical protein